MNDELQHLLPTLLPRLWRFALRLARDPHDAEDLVQRTCVRALERRQQWQAGTAMLSWLFAIEHSIRLNELRSAEALNREQRMDMIAGDLLALRGRIFCARGQYRRAVGFLEEALAQLPAGGNQPRAVEFTATLT